MWHSDGSESNPVYINCGDINCNTCLMCTNCLHMDLCDECHHTKLMPTASTEVSSTSFTIILHIPFLVGYIVKVVALPSKRIKCASIHVHHTRIYSCAPHKNRCDISHICRRYNILSLSLLHWVHTLHTWYMSLVLVHSCADIWSTQNK